MNLGAMMKQIQEMQAKMQEAQAKLEANQVTGQSGGGMVKITMNGKGTLSSVAIDPSLMKPEEKEILEDLLVAAHNDAKSKAERMMAESLKDMTGGLPLPPGLKLPF
jgi:DNA-binding YbaB/EbfC family protein